MKFVEEDNSNCRVYFRHQKLLYCWQDDGSWGKQAWKFYRCTPDGEPWYEVQSFKTGSALELTPRNPSKTKAGADLTFWLAGRQGKSQ